MPRQQAVHPAQEALALAPHLGANLLGGVAPQIVVIDFALQEWFLTVAKRVPQDRLDQLWWIFRQDLQLLRRLLFRHIGIALQRDDVAVS